MAVCVVDGLEIIQIDHEQAQFLLMPLVAFHFFPESGVKIMSIGDMRQAVPVRMCPDLAKFQAVTHGQSQMVGCRAQGEGAVPPQRLRFVRADDQRPRRPFRPY